MTEPTAPIAFDRPAAEVRPRFAPVVEVGAELIAQLRRVGGDVDVDLGTRMAAGRDWWPLTAGWALAGETAGCAAVVVRPRTVGEVAATLSACGAAGVPVTPMAGRSGVCGGSVPVFGGVALDLCGLQGIVAVDDESLLVDVRAGTFGPDLESALRADHGLTLGHWPQSFAMSTVGGWLACRSAGQYSTRYGKIEDMVTGLEVVLADGRVVTLGGRGPRAASGPDLVQLFVGGEGTLGVITEARLRVHPAPPAERRAAYGFTGEDAFAAGLDVCRRVLRRGATPAAIRLYDPVESQRSFSVDGTAVLIVLDEGDPALIDAVIGIVAEECDRGGADRLDVGLVGHWLEHRNDVSALETVVRQGIVVDTIEVAARWSALPPIYRAACAAVNDIPGTFVVSAHQSHAYSDGACLYFTFAGQSPSGDPDGYYRAAWDAVTGATLAHGGALSHHHGVGLNRARFMPEALGAGVDLLAAIARALDPAGILNPGKLGLPSSFGQVTFP